MSLRLESPFQSHCSHTYLYKVQTALPKKLKTPVHVIFCTLIQYAASRSSQIDTQKVKLTVKAISSRLPDIIFIRGSFTSIFGSLGIQMDDKKNHLTKLCVIFTFLINIPTIYRILE